MLHLLLLQQCVHTAVLVSSLFSTHEQEGFLIEDGILKGRHERAPDGVSDRLVHDHSHLVKGDAKTSAKGASHLLLRPEGGLASVLDDSGAVPGSASKDGR